MRHRVQLFGTVLSVIVVTLLLGIPTVSAASNGAYPNEVGFHGHADCRGTYACHVRVASILEDSTLLLFVYAVSNSTPQVTIPGLLVEWLGCSHAMAHLEICAWYTSGANETNLTAVSRFKAPTTEVLTAVDIRNTTEGLAITPTGPPSTAFVTGDSATPIVNCSTDGNYTQTAGIVAYTAGRPYNATTIVTGSAGYAVGLDRTRVGSIVSSTVYQNGIGIALTAYGVIGRYTETRRFVPVATPWAALDVCLPINETYDG